MRFLFASITLLSLAATVYVLTHYASTPKLARPAHTDPCVQVIAGPTQLYWCGNGRAYTRSKGQWSDVGPLTPVPPTPKA